VFDTDSTVPVRFLPDTLGKRDIFLYSEGLFSLISQRAVVFTSGSGTPAFYNLGGPANDHSQNPQISGDGSIVVFDSLATDLVLQTVSPGNYAFKPTYGYRQVYMYNVATAQIRMISMTPAGLAGNGTSQRPYISEDGKWIYFESSAPNLVDGLVTTSVQNVFVYNVTSGRIELVTPGANPSHPNADTRTTRGLDANATITDVSPDGLYVAFESAATNAINGTVDRAGADTNAVQDVFLAANACPDDGDSDGAPDCLDECPADEAKDAPGQCGCGAPDTDTDGDGIADCLDVCETGEEGDLNGNGNADCLDPAPSTVPSQPTVRFSNLTKRRPRVTVQAATTYPNANVTYQFNVVSGSGAGTTVSQSGTSYAFNFQRGRNYKVRYRVVAGSTTSQWSSFKSFRRR
jgi:hypothetical protein